MKKIQLLLMVAGALLLASCAESTTAPSQMRAKDTGAKPAFDFACASGFEVAFDDDGNPYCAPSAGAMSRTAGTVGTVTGKP